MLPSLLSLGMYFLKGGKTIPTGLTSWKDWGFVSQSHRKFDNYLFTFQELAFKRILYVCCISFRDLGISNDFSGHQSQQRSNTEIIMLNCLFVWGLSILVFNKEFEKCASKYRKWVSMATNLGFLPKSCLDRSSCTWYSKRRPVCPLPGN